MFKVLPNRSISILLACLLLLAMSLLSISLGSVHIPFTHINAILCHALGFSVDQVWEDWERIVVLEIRLPRIVLGACVGGALALAGAAMQGMFRNPLACPSVTGVSSGAALGAVIALFCGFAAKSVWTLPVLSFAGGLLSAWIVYALSSNRGHVSISMLLLAGVALSSLNMALVSFILSMALANYEIGKQIVFWTLGGLDQQTWAQVKIALPLIIFGSIVIFYYARDLDALALGELHASSVGIEVARVRRRLIFATALVTAATVSVCGTVAFVGLIVPHIVRLLIGPHHRILFPASLVVGAVFLLAADILARTLIAPEEIRLGVITAAVGGPFFLYLLFRQARSSTYV
jgi:iron complex transport system permease protein